MKTLLLLPLALALALPAAIQARKAEATATCKADNQMVLDANAPLLTSGVLTQLTMASLFATSARPTSNLVTVTVQNNSDSARVFRLLFELKAIPSNVRLRESCGDLLPEEGGEGCWIQRKILTDITLPAHSTWVRTSSQLESETYQSKAIDPDNSPFQRLLIREGYIPPGAIYLNVRLLCPREGLNEDLRITSTSNLSTYSGDQQRKFLASYQPTQAPALLSPGRPANEGFQQIGTSTPTFVFAGNLDGVNLGSESAYRLSIWEIRENEPLGEALDRRPMHTVKLSHSPAAWSGDWPPLESGKRYAWRVDAVLRGFSTDWLPSTPFGFRTPDEIGSIRGSGSVLADGPQLDATMGVTLPPGTDPPRPTPEQLEIMQALSLIIGPYRPILEQLMRTSLPDPSAIHIGSAPATRTEFQNLVREILEGRASVTGAEAKQ